jgi:hypothetical protein
MHVYNKYFIYTYECYTKGNASCEGCVCMYLPHGVGHTKITMIRQQELQNIASNTGFIVCAWHFVYMKMCSNMLASVLAGFKNCALKETMCC